MNSSILFIMLAFFGCGKSKVTPTHPIVPPPVDTTGKDNYKDPAQYGTPFAGVPATKDIVMYEVNLRTYTPANFAGAMARLDSVKALGVNVVWLMPIHPIGTDSKSVGSPYAVKDYTAVKTEFGTLGDMRAYVAKAHSLGMAVIMDWVANHTSWDNAWIANKSWYQQDSGGNIISPPGFNDVAALNYNSTPMRTAMIRAMKYWVFAANIDGYRCDFADNVPNDFWVQSIDTLKNISTHKLIYLAEGTKPAEITAGFQMDYAFDFYDAISGAYTGTKSISGILTTNSNEIAALPSPGIKLRYTTNHDKASSDGSTITIYNGKQGALSAFAIAATLGGVPLIYDSQEVGYPNKINFFADVPVDYTANPDLVAGYKQIIAFRLAHEAVKTGSLTTFNDPNIVAYEKVAGSDDVLILVNAKNSANSFTAPTALQNTTWTNALTGTDITLTSPVALPAYGYMLLKKK